MIRELRVEDAPACDAIVAGLPGWFGDEDGLRDCADAVRSQAGIVVDEGGEVLGFLTHEPRETGVAEITWMAVRADRRRGGLGTSLLDATVAELADSGLRLLLVKSRSDRDGPDREYDQTLAFYAERGFLRVAELDIWGPENPALLMARPL